MPAAAFLAMTPESLTALVARLPAQMQADIRWAPEKLKVELAPLFADDLTASGIAEVAQSAWTAVLRPVVAVLDVLPDADLSDLQLNLQREIAAEARRIEQLSISAEAQRAIFRALSTLAMMGIFGLTTIQFVQERQGAKTAAQFRTELRRLTEDAGTPSDFGTWTQAWVLTAAMLHGSRTGVEKNRLEALADAADRASFKLAADLLNAQPPICLGWYFEGPNTEQFRRIAFWAEAPQRRARVLAATIRDWSNEGDDAAAAQEWQEVRAGLEQSRASERRLFR